MKNPTIPLPQTQVPELSCSLTSGEKWTLSNQDPGLFTMIVFYRGLHCPVCKSYTRTLDGMVDKFNERGVEAVAISMDNEKRARKSVQDWGIDTLPVGYGLSEEEAREWGLYLSHSIKDEEPALFSEPGLFLVRPNAELYYAAINSMPFGRPDLEDFLKAIDYIKKQDYPARGEVEV